MRTAEEEQWFVSGFLAGRNGQPFGEMYALLMPGADAELKALSELAAATDRETKDRENTYKVLGDLLKGDESAYREMLTQAQASSSALETVKSHGGVVWLMLATAGTLLPATMTAGWTSAADVQAQAVPLVIAMGTMLATWSGTLKYMPLPRREALASHSRTTSTLGLVVASGVVMGVLIAPWPLMGAVIGGSAAGVALACRRTRRDATLPIVSDLSRQLDRARSESASHAAEQATGRDRLRASSHETVEAMASIETQRARMRAIAALGYQLGSSIQQRTGTRTGKN